MGSLEAFKENCNGNRNSQRKMSTLPAHKMETVEKKEFQRIWEKNPHHTKRSPVPVQLWPVPGGSSLSLEKEADTGQHFF